RMPAPGAHRLLVVDAKDGHREAIANQAAAVGFQAHAVAAGADALWLLDQAARVGEPYDGVVCDVNLPDMSAFDFARSVRANPAHGDVRVAMCAMLISGADPESFRE